MVANRHGVRDGRRGAGNDSGLGCPVRADRGDHRVDIAQRGGEDCDVRTGQVLPYDLDIFDSFEGFRTTAVTA